MFEGHRIGGVLLMGGEGRRFGSEVPKQFLLLGGKKVYLHALEAFLRTSLFDEIVLACHPAWLEEVQKEVSPFSSVLQVVPGGSTRQASSYAGLQGFAERPEIVALHDAVRPFVSEAILLENILVALRWGAVDTCIPSADTLVYAPEEAMVASIPDRSDFLRGQTPQTFRYRWILEAHEKALKKGSPSASDDCRLVLEMGRKVRIVQGSEENFKITTEFDLALANLLVKKLAPSHLCVSNGLHETAKS